jgi:hypothetical protein
VAIAMIFLALFDFVATRFTHVAITSVQRAVGCSVRWVIDATTTATTTLDVEASNAFRNGELACIPATSATATASDGKWDERVDSRRGKINAATPCLP